MEDSGKKHAHCLFLKLAFCTPSILSGEEIFLQRCTFLELAHSKKNNKKWSWVESHPPLWLGAHRCERNPWGTTPPCPEIKSKNYFVLKKSPSVTVLENPNLTMILEMRKKSRFFFQVYPYSDQLGQVINFYEQFSADGRDRAHPGGHEAKEYTSECLQWFWGKLGLHRHIQWTLPSTFADFEIDLSSRAHLRKHKNDRTHAPTEIDRKHKKRGKSTPPSPVAQIS